MPKIINKIGNYSYRYYHDEWVGITFPDGSSESGKPKEIFPDGIPPSTEKDCMIIELACRKKQLAQKIEWSRTNPIFHFDLSDLTKRIGELQILLHPEAKEAKLNSDASKLPTLQLSHDEDNDVKPVIKGKKTLKLEAKLNLLQNEYFNFPLEKVDNEDQKRMYDRTLQDLEKKIFLAKGKLIIHSFNEAYPNVPEPKSDAILKAYLKTNIFNNDVFIPAEQFSNPKLFANADFKHSCLKK